MGFYERQVLPRLVHVVLSGPAFSRLRARATSGLTGDVLEIGFGSGANVPHYPASVTRVWAVDPATVGRKLAAGRVAASPVPVHYVGLDGQDVPLEDSSVDHVLSTWTLCTIPDAERALAEVSRVLRPGGTLRFVEHGRSPRPEIARWQERLTPLQRRIAGGCHLDRQIDALVTGAGLTMASLEHPHMPGPEVLGYLFEGVAVKA
jgi:ubiquinone/menaquinone biosynthesis C-methylase UbiE